MKPFFLFLALVFCSVMFSEVSAKEQLNGHQAFDRMKSLVGDWHKEGVEKPKLILSFELTANNTVLVETWLHKGKKHSLTMYHLDNENLVATHYCPQGNQPRLKLASSSADKLAFSFLDATNLASLSDPHLHTLGFNIFNDVDKIHRTESYLSGAGENASELRLVRRQ